MAKVTTEDCLEIIPNRFEMILIASNRARELMHGEPAIIPVRKGEKPCVTALREVATGQFTEEKLNKLRKVHRKQFK